MSTHARPLAVWLAAASDSQLATLFEARGVRPDSSWADFFDAAEALLDPASIERMLPRLSLPEATALRSAVAVPDNTAPTTETAPDDSATLVALGLLRPDGTPFQPVIDAVSARELPEIASSVEDAAPPRERRRRHMPQSARSPASRLSPMCS